MHSAHVCQYLLFVPVLFVPCYNVIRLQERGNCFFGIISMKRYNIYMYAIVGKFRLVIPIAYAWRCFKLQGTGEEMFEVTKLKLE